MARKYLSQIDMGSQQIKNLASGSASTDAVNKSQLDAAIAGLSWHGAVRAASTGNVTLTAPGTTLDGVTLAVNDRILLKNQTAPAENGVYIFNGSAATLTRATDGTQGNLASGATFSVDEGTTLADTAWTLTTDGTITIGTTSLTFARFAAGGTSYTAGTGISSSSLSGGTIAIDTAVVVRKFASNIGDGSSTSITVTHSFGTLDVMVQLVEVSTGATVDTDTVRNTVNQVTFTFASAPTSNQYRAIIQG